MDIQPIPMPKSTPSEILFDILCFLDLTEISFADMCTTSRRWKNLLYQKRHLLPLLNQEFYIVLIPTFDYRNRQGLGIIQPGPDLDEWFPQISFHKRRHERWVYDTNNVSGERSKEILEKVKWYKNLKIDFPPWMIFNFFEMLKQNLDTIKAIVGRKVYFYAEGKDWRRPNDQYELLKEYLIFDY